MDAQLKKGVLEMCILYVVSQKEMYGYDIMLMMHEYFPDVNESTFYAILRRLHKEGAADTYMGAESNGPPRKYYKITEAGIQALRLSIQEWRELNRSIEELGILIRCI